MPELPEVEVFVRNLQPAVGKTVRKADVLDPRLGLDGQALSGRRIHAVERLGKHIVIRFREGGTLVVHLRMSGRLRLHRNQAEVKYTRLALHLEDGTTIFFVNPRRLGTAVFCQDGFEKSLGYEPLDPAFTSDSLAEMTERSRSPIKHFLLDQRKVAGIGNIYASESLFRSRIHPAREANGLSQEEVRRLHRSIVAVLNDAINGQGTSLGNGVSDYHPAAGAQGEFQNHLSVYGREDEPCEQCGHPIRRMKQSGRSTYYCEHCQN